MDIKSSKLWCAFIAINAQAQKIERYRKLTLAMVMLNAATVAFAMAVKLGYV